MSVTAVFVGEVSSVGTKWTNSVGRWLQDIATLSPPVDPSPRLVDCSVDCSLTSDTEEQRKDKHLRRVLRTAVADQEIRQPLYKPRLSDNNLDRAVDALKDHPELVALNSEALVARGLKSYRYLDQLEDTARHRRPFAGKGGLLGLGPAEMEVGELIYILVGATVPYLLRKDAEGKLRVVGDAYIHGVMDGEIMARRPRLHTITIH